MLQVLANQNSLVHNFLKELRSVVIQKDSMRFRRNLERIGEIMAYEISKTLEFNEEEVNTPLGKTISKVAEKVVLANVLRAGLPLHQGLLNYFDAADSAFVSAYRKYTSQNKLEVAVEYIAAPSIQDKVMILSDPMLATGTSILLAREALLKNGVPKHIHIVSVVASQYAIDHIQEALKGYSFILWVGAIDSDLDENSYIVPGLGDAGDLAFGVKL
ncbi:MAG: uracil phosphoribosyltransferase [Flavobacteriales bacterium]|nr:uracil phosphoribosyltransferase [Flavobacteriales bacterium]